MDAQPTEQRINQLKMWIKESKNSLKVLMPIKQLLEHLKDTHAMHINNLSGAISELEKAIESEFDLNISSTKELREYNEIKL